MRIGTRRDLCPPIPAHSVALGHGQLSVMPVAESAVSVQSAVTAENQSHSGVQGLCRGEHLPSSKAETVQEPKVSSWPLEAEFVAISQDDIEKYVFRTQRRIICGFFLESADIATATQPDNHDVNVMHECVYVCVHLCTCVGINAELILLAPLNIAAQSGAREHH